MRGLNTLNAIESSLIPILLLKVGSNNTIAI